MLSHGPRLPTFFIAGVPKAGTTSLYHYLDQHPEIYMSPIKEPSYFSLEIRLENFGADMQEATRRDMPLLREYLDGDMAAKRFGGPVTNWGDYLKLFAQVKQEKAAGEASVCYFWSETAARRIAEQVPDAKIVAILRDPSERAYSHYLQAVRLGFTQGTFREYIEEDLRCKDPAFTMRHPFLAFGNYYQQLKRYFETFPESNTRIFLYEDFSRNAPGVVRQIFEFLGVDATFQTDMSQRYLESRAPRFGATQTLLKGTEGWQRLRKFVPRAIRRSLRPTLWSARASESTPQTERAFLVDYYADDIQKTARLLNCDLSAWLAA